MGKKKYRRNYLFNLVSANLFRALKLLLIALSIFCVLIGGHGIYVYFNRLEILSADDANKLFLTWTMPDQLAGIVEWSSRSGLQSWLIPTIIILAGIALWVFQTGIRGRRFTKKFSVPEPSSIMSVIWSALFLKERKRSQQLRFVNQYRRKHGLSPLRAYYELDRIAKSHSKYMAKHHTCNHDGFAKRSARISYLTGSDYVAENCFMYPAKGYNKRVAKELVKGWIKSPGHRENLLDPNFRKIGIGIVTKNGYVYATQVFSG